MNAFSRMTPVLRIGGSLLIAALVVGLVAAFWEYTQDDVFITYVYSRNLVEGLGFVFNPGEQVQGTTTPLYTLLMAGVYMLTPDLLHAGNALGGVFLLLSCGLIWLLRPHADILTRLAACLLVVSSPLIYVSLGMETLLYTLLLLFGFWLWARRLVIPALLVAALLTWTRADGVVLGGTLGLLALWDAARGRLSPGRMVAAGLVYALVTAAWFGFAWAYFGTPLPNTFSAKEDSLGGLRFIVDGIGFFNSFYGNNPPALIGLLFVPVGGWAAWCRPDLRALSLWALLYTLGYTILNTTAFWYYTPLAIVLMMLAALGAQQVFSLLARRLKHADAPLIRLAAVGLLAVAVGLSVARALDFAAPPPRVAAYERVGRWINANTPAEATLTVGDLGIMGYHARRHTVDSPGLIVPDMYYKNDAYAVMKYKTDLVVATRYFSWAAISGLDWFRDHYMPLVQISEAGDVEFSPMIIFQRRLALTPPQVIAQGLDLPLTCIVERPAGEPLPQTTRARLMTSDGGTLAQAQQEFLRGVYPVDVAAYDERLIEQIALPLDVPPGQYGWELACGDRVQTGIVTVQPLAQQQGYQPVDADWPDVAELGGVWLPDGDQTWSGGTLRIALDWQPLAITPTDYSVFLHLIDSDGRLIAQRDGPPQSGRISTVDWSLGAPVADVRYISLPPDLPANEYQLVIGWYDWRSDARLLLADDTDALRLPVTIENRLPDRSSLR